MIVVHVHAYTHPDRVEEFKTATLVNAQKSVQEPGIARFDVLQNQNDPTHFILVEVYRTPDAPGRHKETMHYKVWREDVEKMMAAPRESFKYTNIFPPDENW